MKSRNYSGSGFKVQSCPLPGVQTKAGRLPGVIITLLLILLPFIPSSGKVFWSRFLTQGQSIFDTTGSWRRIYKAPLTINGARASLSVYGCDAPLQSVTEKLKQSFCLNNKENHLVENENSTQFSSADRNQASRLLMLRMPGTDQSVIFELSQPLGEISKTPALPSESVVLGRLLPAESSLTAIIKNEETGAVLETRIADAAPDIIIGEISAKLSRYGWKCVYPSSADSPARLSGRSTPAKPESAMAERRTSPAGNSKQCFLIFQRGAALCTLLAGPALHENKTCVTILLKEKMDNMGE